MLEVITIQKLDELKSFMQGLGVDAYGTDIMAPKALLRLIRISSISCIAANLLKQEMLSLGADAALPRNALTGGRKKTNCLLIGSLSQYSRLIAKLIRQPFGLGAIAKELEDVLANYQKEGFVLKAARMRLTLKAGRSYVMGIVNATPDSFSGDGLYRGRAVLSAALYTNSISEFAQKLQEDGADIIDVGGVSSRPGAHPLPLKEELARVIPAVRAMAKKIKIPISVDTSNPDVAQRALDNGAVIVNDITGMRDPRMARIAARFKAAVVIMHMQGTPVTMQKKPVYKSLVEEISDFFRDRIERCASAGIKSDQIMLDPGIGFGKTPEHNMEIIHKLMVFKPLGMPILIGPSRKSFIGEVLKAGPQERLYGTIASSVLAVHNGAKIVRVHDVLAVKQALTVADTF